LLLFVLVVLDLRLVPLNPLSLIGYVLLVLRPKVLQWVSLLNLNLLLSLRLVVLPVLLLLNLLSQLRLPQKLNPEPNFVVVVVLLATTPVA
jgi:hypothetical protein